MAENIFFVKSVFEIKDTPKLKLPQIILCGRSNVGKSSFINSLFNKKDLAKTSSTPGKTRSINYYSANEKYYFIDLPGYGYAKTSKGEQEHWADLLKKFFEKCDKHSFAFHFIDSRHPPTRLDESLKELILFHSLKYIIILNKVDKLNQSELALAKSNIQKFYEKAEVKKNLFFYSAVKGSGKKEILKKIEELIQLN
jgi:GTP-binding protein